MFPVHPLEQATINRLDGMGFDLGQYLEPCVPTLALPEEFREDTDVEEE